jgi:hypothetical protein
MVIAACNASADISAERPIGGIENLVEREFVALIVASIKRNDAEFDN